MSKIVQALHSRTIWTIVVMLAFNVIPHLNVDQSLKDLVNGILVMVAGYFHVNPLQQGTYTPAGVTPPVVPPVIIDAPVTTPLSTPVI